MQFFNFVSFTFVWAKVLLKGQTVHSSRFFQRFEKRLIIIKERDFLGHNSSATTEAAKKRQRRD